VRYRVIITTLTFVLAVFSNVLTNPIVQKLQPVWDKNRLDRVQAQEKSKESQEKQKLEQEQQESNNFIKEGERLRREYAIQHNMSTEEVIDYCKTLVKGDGGLLCFPYK
jgi:hypothetical protein